MLGFLAYSPVDALGAIELPNSEFLLVFNTLGVYVDMQGRKSRDREIMYPAVPTDISVCDGKLLVYSDTHIDVFDTVSGDWVQSINIRKTSPLIKSGQLNLSMLQEMPHVTYLSNIHKGKKIGSIGSGARAGFFATLWPPLFQPESFSNIYRTLLRRFY